MKKMSDQQYFSNLEKDVLKVYKIAEEARKKGLDPKREVEIPLAILKYLKYYYNIKLHFYGCALKPKYLEHL